jgi:FixJ family two-component response regulator
MILFPSADPSDLTQNQYASTNKGRHVYLLEDHESFRMIIEKVLTVHGFIVHAFENPYDFLSLKSIEAPAVIVTDMRMPKMNGVELQAEIAARGRQIPFVFISGEASLDQGLKAMKQGAIEFLIKPFDIDELMKAVVKGFEQDIRHSNLLLLNKKQEDNLAKLTKRERDIYGLLLKSYNNNELAEATGLTINTIKDYKAKVMEKMGVKTLAELIRQNSEIK